MEQLGRILAVAPHDVDPAGIGSALVDVAGIAERLCQRRALLVHDQRTRLGDLAENEDLVVATVGDVDDVAVFEQRIVLRATIVIHRLYVDQIGAAAAGEQDAAEVGLRAEAAGAVDRIENRHRHVVDRLDSRLCHLADDIDLLAAESHHAHIELHAFDELGKSGRQNLAQLAGRPACRLDHSDVRVEDRAVFGNHRAGLFGSPEAAGRDRQFRVIPDDDRDDVSRPQAIAGHCRELLAPVAWVVRRCRLRRAGAIPDWRQRRLEQIDDQLGGDRSDADIGRHQLVSLLNRQPHVGFFAVGVALVAGNDRAPRLHAQSKAQKHCSPGWPRMSQQVHASILNIIASSSAPSTADRRSRAVYRRQAHRAKPAALAAREANRRAGNSGRRVVRTLTQQLPRQVMVVSSSSERISPCDAPSGAKSHTAARKVCRPLRLQQSLLTQGSSASSINSSASACASSPRR